MLVNFCQYKIEKVGGKLIEIDRFFPSSQICSHCGHRDGKKPLSVREWTCPSCGTHHDRDEKASKNIREEGLRILTAGTTVTALGDSVRPSKSNFGRRGSVRRFNPTQLAPLSRTTSSCVRSRSSVSTKAKLPTPDLAIIDLTTKMQLDG
jgi:putative transposase